MEEIWKDIEGYDGRYKVSNMGNVKSMNYGNHGYAKNLVPKVNNCGRLWVELIKDGEKKQFLIHRLVGKTFIPNPHNLPEINHKDENVMNNVVDNLEWCTKEYNLRYTANRHPEWFRHGSNPGRSRASKNKHLLINQYDADGKLLRQWPNARSVFVETGMSDWSIAECCRGKRKQAYGFKWQYAILDTDQRRS